ncbi:hypothetical protein NQ317_004685 [Molorchus minor]|uniref:T-complex-associated testis-expressed protein 1 n=1 Tax=Molorchus minor TaxID=1323400 RepID=A0ABQ9JG47_9CUCU|nr:hypothetical protein NQ317_004685 [Molorchus minor]
MRIPHIISKDTHIAYQCSPQSLDLVGEDQRKLLAEDIEWDKDHCPTLVDYSVQAISEYFERNPLLNDLPGQDRDYLLEIVSTDLPLELVIPLIEDEYYWQRRYNDKFSTIIIRKPKVWTWKSLYLERHVQQIIEEAQPQHKDEDTFDEILTLCSEYVRRLIVTQLQWWQPPLTMEKDEIPEIYPIAHINFTPIFLKLPLIEEFRLTYGMNNVGMDFDWNMFKLSVEDCQRLGIALLSLPNLTILRINRTVLEYKNCQALMQGLIFNQTLTELDLSNCQIDDEGALCVAKLLGSHPTLKILNLSNNCIKQLGAEGIGFTLLQESCAQLDVLNLRLNPLGNEGTLGIMRALVRCDIPKEVSMSGVLFDDDTPMKVGKMIKINKGLKKLDLSNNWFGEDGGTDLVEAMEINTTLEWLDVRDTDITPYQAHKIKKFLIRNRKGVIVMDEEVEEEAECEDDEERVIKETVYQDEVAHEESENAEGPPQPPPSQTSTSPGQ